MVSPRASESGRTLTLDEVVEAAQRKLEGLGLADASADGRVAAVPDARAIRYYATLGLVDRPSIANRQARYTERHVRQIIAIKSLQASGLPLAEIQGRLYGRSDAELDAIVTSAAPTRRQQTASARATRWIEVVIDPGIRLVVDESRLASSLPDDIETRLRDALASLRKSQQHSKEQQ